jgi:hypothetical protein
LLYLSTQRLAANNKSYSTGLTLAPNKSGKAWDATLSSAAVAAAAAAGVISVTTAAGGASTVSPFGSSTTSFATSVSSPLWQQTVVVSS